ncbi:hypothetical protein BDR26DRAFT_862348 [Obelidium mucronatum]|nr:hypothetical protein BDR26DRAFT_862348 [Obelidium mucronatum]
MVRPRNPSFCKNAKEAETTEFISTPLPNHPLTLASNQPHPVIDSVFVGNDARVYSLLLASHLLTNDLVAARLLVRRVPRHVSLSFELNLLCEVAAALYMQNPAKAINLLTEAKTLPVLPTIAVSVTPSPATLAILLPSPNSSIQDILAAAQNNQTQPRAFSGCISPVILDALVDSITSRVLVLTALGYTSIKIDALKAMVSWSQERVLIAVQDGSLADLMRVESVQVDGDCIVIVKGDKFKGDPTTASFGPGLQQVRDLADYLVHLEREL